MIFFVLFFRFFSLKLAALCVFICEIGWYGRSACSQTHLVGDGGAVAVAAVFCQLFFSFFCSTIFKHICLFLSLSACISCVSFFGLFIFSFQLESKEDKINQKHRTNLIAHASHFVEYYVLLSIFGTISLQFVHLILVSYHYTHNVYIFHIHFVCFFFVCLESFVCMFFIHNDWYQIHEYNWNVFCFLSFAFKLKRKKRRSCWARYTITLKMSQMNHALTLTKLYCSNPFGCFAQSVFDGGSERKRAKLNYQNPWNMK